MTDTADSQVKTIVGDEKEKDEVAQSRGTSDGIIARSKKRTSTRPSTLRNTSETSMLRKKSQETESIPTKTNQASSNQRKSLPTRRKSVASANKDTPRSRMANGGSPLIRPSDSTSESGEEESSLSLSHSDTLSHKPYSYYRLRRDESLQYEEGSPIPKAGEIHAIIEWLVDTSDEFTNLCFLASYRLVWGSSQLFDYISEKLRYEHQDTSPQSSSTVFATLDFLRLWIDNFYQRDFTTDFNSTTLYKFLSEIQDAGIHDATQLKLLIMRRAGQKLHSQFFVEASQGKKKAKLKKTPTTLVSPQNTQISFDSISANDFAACLCLSDWELFSDIPESEWTNKVWTYDKECIYSISKMVKRFNNLSFWTGEVIAKEPDVKERANILKKMIAILEKLLEMNNFHSAMAIAAGLNVGAITRLERTWAIVPSASKASFEKANKIVSAKQNFAHYRNLLAQVKQPCIPYVGVCMRDFVFIEDGNPLHLDNYLINFDRLHLQGKLLMELKTLQKVGFGHISPNPPVQKFIENISANDDVDYLYDLSLKMEPSGHPDV